MSTPPDITVIVPYHNEADTITTTLELIARQSLPPREVILVDSASTDESHRIVDDWIRNRSGGGQRIDFRNVNAGTNVPSSSKNAGIRLSSCDTVAFMDCGLLFGSDWLKKQVEFMGAGDYPVVSGGVVLDGSNCWDRAAAAQTYGYRRFRPCVPSTVARKTVFQRTGPFHEGLRAGYDVEWPEKLRQNGIRRGINPGVIVRYNGVNYADSHSTLFRKSIAYARGTLGLSGYRVPYVYLAAALMAIVAVSVHPPLFGPLLLAYLIGRGYLVPLAKSRGFRFLARHPVLWLTLPLAGILIDAGKMVGLARRMRELLMACRPGAETHRPVFHSPTRSQAAENPFARREAASANGPICRVATVPITFATLLCEQIRYLTAKGMKMTIVSSPEALLQELAENLGASCRSVPLSRKVTPLRDLKAVFQLYRIFRQGNYPVVHSSTPKAGLVTALAGISACVPVRLHTYTGQVWVEKQGAARWILKACDAVIARLDTSCYADSHSQMDFLVREKVVPRSKIRVLGDGSISGVDLQRFDPEILSKNEKAELRRSLGISDAATVILFVGRMTKDKGVCELLKAFEALEKTHPGLHLLLVGPLEPERDPLPKPILERIEGHPSVHAVGFQTDVERYMAISDIFCLPSYREGFGSVVIEAGAMGLPSVATRVVGLVDSVVDGKTGLLVEPKSAAALARGLHRMISGEDLRRNMGHAARSRAGKRFGSDRVNERVRAEYVRWLTRDGNGMNRCLRRRQ